MKSPWDMLYFAWATKYFPLTLTLSLREKGQQAPGWCLANGRWVNSGTGLIENLWTVLPLPRQRDGVRGNRVWSIHGPTSRPNVSRDMIHVLHS